MAFAEPPVIGYHKIRGLAGPLRMMCCYAGQPYVNKAYGSDLQESWFGSDKVKLAVSNSCINLPYIRNGDEVVTQSITCLLYLARKLALDIEANFFKNHTVLSQVLDMRNDLMEVVYPFAGKVKAQADFPAAAKQHLKGSVTTTYTKLEAFCTGPYMCGDTPQSGDFALWEQLDQNLSICVSLGESNVLDRFPKLKALHAALLAEPNLRTYFESDQYSKWGQNNGLFTFYTGQGEDFEYGPTVEELFTPSIQVQLRDAPNEKLENISGRRGRQVCWGAPGTLLGSCRGVNFSS
jgi:glutathione S-transferase